jgi:hypothetical protein
MSVKRSYIPTPFQRNTFLVLTTVYLHTHAKAVLERRHRSFRSAIRLCTSRMPYDAHYDRFSAKYMLYYTCTVLNAQAVYEGAHLAV